MTPDPDELERIGKKAAEAPWGHTMNLVSAFPLPNGVDSLIADCRSCRGTYVNFDGNDTARFIATARNNWQAMVDGLREAERLREEVVKLRAILARGGMSVEEAAKARQEGREGLD